MFFSNYVSLFLSSINMTIDIGFLFEIEINVFEQIKVKSKNRVRKSISK